MAIYPSNLLVNIGSLRGQQALNQADSALTRSIRNLTSGLRIHSGKDDPVGFVGATAMQTEISSLTQAVANSERNNAVIATVDSALSHINALLNDLRGLVTEAASTGSETPETLAALQIQADAIVDTINRISETTTFQNQKLLDGSLDFSTYGTDNSKISLLNLYQANFQGRTEKDIVVQVHEPAKQAQLYYPYGALSGATSLTIGGSGGYSSFAFDKDATVQDIADAINLISDSTGVAAEVFAKSAAGSFALTSYGKNNDVIVTASEPGTAAGNFVFRYTAPREGNEQLHVNVSEGSGNDPTVVEIMLQTEPGGKVLTTAEQVVTLLNTSPLLKKPDGNGRITASLPAGSHGLGTVTPFAEAGYYGNANDNNLLQFLAPAGSPAVRFVSTPGTPLSADDTTAPPKYAQASAQIQGFEAGTSFTLKSLLSGPEGDGIKIVFRDAAAEGASYDPVNKTLTFSADFTGRANDPARGDLSMNDLIQMIESDADLNNRFSIIPQSAFTPDTAPVFQSANYTGINTTLGTTAGGVIDPGFITIHLETDENGIVKTTANDLVRFFNDPSTEESKAVLDRWGISVAVIDPASSAQTVCTTGKAEIGKGLLTPTYDIHEACPPDGYPDIHFSSYGADIQETFPSATVISGGGRNADWTLTAKNAGAAYNNVTIKITTDAAEPSVQYDPVSKQLTVCIDPRNPSTAEEIVTLINNDPAVSALFAASLPSYSGGQGLIAASDKATLTGGIVPADFRAEGFILSSGGINASFNVKAKRGDHDYSGTEILVAEDPSGPKVSYDSQAKQLTIGVAPGKPVTAQQIVDLINTSPDVKELFEASIPLFLEGTTIVPDGSGFVQIGDTGMLQTPATGTAMGAAMLGAGDSVSLGLVIYSVGYGSKEFIDVRSTSGIAFPVTDRFGNTVEKTFGTDVVADINGRRAIGDGRAAMSATTDLDISVTTAADVQRGDVFGFRISGGGTLMQLGPTATWSQQIRISIPSIHSTALGGETGKLSQIKTDEPFSLLADSHTAFQIIEESITQITTLRGRLGALQKTQIEQGMENMQDAITIETDARSQIADVDFTAESSNFTRQQLLMQSSITVLQQSSMSKQLLLSLLQG
ncbi:MAG: hypothetical protein LBH00_11295 [Planctomycetaceae bacterium]|jgi:flagellin-like hook-associated protein FlgL|nr:hypothetical protein [Planctomycetaceae bacterium]